MGGSRTDSVRAVAAAEGAPSQSFEPPRKANIGAPLRALSEKLLESGRILGELLEPAGVGLANEAVRLLLQQVCRIAVVGQIKSGKSSFVNAFIQRPNLLPTDVNPWTTAVTNLHFCQTAPNGNAATFRFFTESEWQRLAEGGGKLRELTERLVPGFEPELLRRNVDAVKQRAASRLGSEFQSLLGQAHRFPSINAEVLQQYVCSGDFAPRDKGTVSVGHYSDITKAADLYLDRGPFDFPVTIIDTPGTNDPFLLRDEITRHSLESADLYVVVLTARQPLSESDVALLRILRGLHKERIVVFLNRIDELADIGGDLKQVQDFVRQKLALEFPGTEVPIIAGSAWWGTCALNLDAAAIDRILERRSLAYFLESGLLRREDLVRPAVETAAGNQILRNSLFACSGMPAIYAKLNEMMGTSHCAYVIRQVAACFIEMARASENAARAELQSLNVVHNSALITAMRAGQQLDHLQKEIDSLAEVASTIERSGKEIEQQLSEIIRQEMTALRTELQKEIDVHAANERDVLTGILEHGRAPKVWKHEALELRRRLADVFLAGFQRAEARVLDLQSKVTPELRHLLSIVAPEAAPLEPEWGNLDMPAPVIAPLSSFVALDLDHPWWIAWWKARPSPQERGEQLEALIKAEFYPVVEELITSSEWVLGSYAGTTTRWSFAMCSNIIQALQRRREQLRTHFEDLSGRVDGSADADTVRGQGEQIEDLTRRLAQCEEVGRKLGEAVTDFAASFAR